MSRQNSSATAAHKPLYRVIALEDSHPGSAHAVAINDAGTIVGWLANPMDPAHHKAVRWESGSLDIIGPDDTGVSTEAIAINDDGQIVGRAYSPGGTSYGWVQTGDEIMLLTVRDGTVEPHDLNNLGQVVGSIGRTQQANGYTDTIHEAFLWDAERYRSIAASLKDPSVIARAISDVGEVAGYSTCGCIPARGPQSFVCDGSTVTELVGFGGDARALAINNGGQVAGEAEVLAADDGTVRSVRHAFLWEGGSMIDLGCLPGSECGAAAINDVGQIVGMCKSAGASRAFVHDGRTMIDLNDIIPANSAWVLQEAHDINNDGLIVGDGLYQGVQRAFLLRPIQH